MTLMAVAQGLASVLERVEAITGRVSAVPTENPLVPSASVRLESFTASVSHGQGAPIGTVVSRWSIAVYASRTSVASGVQTLYDLIDPAGTPSTSVVRAVAVDPTLGGACDTLVPPSVVDVGATPGDDSLLTATLEVLIYATV